MARDERTEVLVAGAGPVGLFTALALRQKGVRTRVIDSGWRSAALSYALALHPRSIELLDDLGVAGELAAQGCRVDRVAFYEGEDRRAEFPLTRTGSRFPFLLVLPQNVFEATLERALLSAGPGPEWCRELIGLTIGSDGAEATVAELSKASGGYAVSRTEWTVERTFPIPAALIAGADGHRSAVRRALGIPFPEHAPPEHYAVFEFEADLDAPDEVRVAFAPEGPSVLWPLPKGRCRFSFRLAPGSETLREREKSRVAVPIAGGLYPELRREDLHDLVAARAPWFCAEIGEVAWSLLVRFEHRIAERFGGGPAWLAGDAAHTTSPVGIRSMNAGLVEAADLAARFEAVLRGRAGPGDLEDSGARRLAEWRRLVGMEGDTTPPAGADAFVASSFSRIIDCLPATGDHLRALAGIDG
ncbi:MAG: FAD-dependent monooxygenase [Planctomycetes bacterium]|jgi:2-polyprenyl-6-methoxyphenol hydroxylase-like FAD-dependent oxidoreductase|nr:FAD-dependent monooxygenase [Planctomycetota bacterium]